MKPFQTCEQLFDFKKVQKLRFDFLENLKKLKSVAHRFLVQIETFSQQMNVSFCQCPERRRRMRRRMRCVDWNTTCVDAPLVMRRSV